MNCPNCGALKLMTVETFQQPTRTVRTKKCRECKWTFTSNEEISDTLEIPASLRDSKRRPGYRQEFNEKRRQQRSQQ